MRALAGDTGDDEANAAQGTREDGEGEGEREGKRKAEGIGKQACY